MKQIWSCDKCSAKGSIIVTEESSGVLVIKSAQRDHTEISPDCDNTLFNINAEDTHWIKSEDNLNYVEVNYAARLAQATDMIKAEVFRAATIHSPMTTAHEGKAVIEEELDELWDEVKLFPNIDREALLKEAVHIGAMAARFIADICSVGSED